MKVLLISFISLLFTINSFSQTIFHSCSEYELGYLDSNKKADKKENINANIIIVYSYCENNPNNIMLITIYKLDGSFESITLKLFSKEVNKEGGYTLFDGMQYDKDPNSIFYSPDEAVLIMMKEDRIGISFNKVQIRIFDYKTEVSYK